jgi:hypothetical protein
MPDATFLKISGAKLEVFILPLAMSKTFALQPRSERDSGYCFLNISTCREQGIMNDEVYSFDKKFLFVSGIRENLRLRAVTGCIPIL